MNFTDFEGRSVVCVEVNSGGGLYGLRRGVENIMHSTCRRNASAHLVGGRHCVGMFELMRTRAAKVTLVIVGLLLAVAAATHMYTSQSNDVTTGEVSSTSVQYSGESVSTVSLQIMSPGGQVSAVADASSVPSAGDTVALFQGEEAWDVPQHAGLLAVALFPLTHGLPILIGAVLVVLLWGGLASYRGVQRGQRDDVHLVDSPVLAAAPQGSTSSESRTPE